MAERKVYVLLTDTGTLFTKTIKLYTGKPYNHASIAFDENLTEVYSFGRKRSRNPFIGGFVREDIKNGLLKDATCAVYRLKISEIDFKRMQHYIKKIEAGKENYRYNFIGLFAVILNKKLTRKNTFFCSQFVASVLKQSSSVDFNKPLSLVTPYDLQVADDLELVYQGKLEEYDEKVMNQQNILMTESPLDVFA